MRNMASNKAWQANVNNIVHTKDYEDIQVKYNPAKEFRTVKHNAQDAIAALLEMLPEDNLACGMARVLANWLDSEIAILPDDLFCEEKA